MLELQLLNLHLKFPVCAYMRTCHSNSTLGTLVLI